MSEQKREDRPKLREELIGFEYCYQWCGKTAYTCKKQSTCPAFQDKDGTPFNLASHSIAKAKADHLLALFPDVEGAEARLELIRRLTARCEQLRDEAEEAKKQVACALFEEIICPMCYRLNPQHATMDYGKGCHYCQEREDWQALKELEELPK